MRLFEIDQYIRSILDSLYEDPDENGEIQEDAFAILNDLIAQRDQKWESIALYIKEMIAEAEALKKEKQALEARQKRAEKKAENLKKYLTQSITEAGQERFETTRCQISFRKSVACIVKDEEAIPSPYRAPRIEYKIDTKELTKALKRGEAIEGAYLEDRNNIQIK